MNKKVIACALCATMLVPTLAACGKTTEPALGKVNNIGYEDGVLAYDAVDGADGYAVVFTHGGEVVYEDKIQDTSIDVESLGLAGNITVTVAAYKGDATGEAVEYGFAALTEFGEVIFEAEDNLYNFGTGKTQSNFRNNTLAHKGAYVGGIDDAGQGVYINYLCPVAGEYDFTAYYTTDMNPAHNDVWVNGEYMTRFDFDEKTGWGGDRYDAAPATVKIALDKGWNTISVMKNGDETDNYGSFAELDYFVLTGDGSKYNVDDLAEFGARPEKYILEAEMGSPRKRSGDIMTCKNPCIREHDDKKFSNGFLMGGIESNYDGVEWHFNSPVKAKYRVRIAYASGEFAGSKKAAPTFIVTQEEVGLVKNADFADYEQKTLASLPYTGWDTVALSEQTVEITLEQGKNFIYCLLLDSADSGFFQIDYIELAFIEAIEDAQ